MGTTAKSSTGNVEKLGHSNLDGVQVYWAKTSSTVNANLNGISLAVFLDSGREQLQLTGIKPSSFKTKDGSEVYAVHTNRIDNLQAAFGVLPTVRRTLQAGRDKIVRENPELLESNRGNNPGGPALAGDEIPF